MRAGAAESGDGRSAPPSLQLGGLQVGVAPPITAHRVMQYSRVILAVSARFHRREVGGARGARGGRSRSRGGGGFPVLQNGGL